jgi:thioredoxin 1
MIVSLDQDEWDLLTGAGPRVLAYFTADWCEPCKRMYPSMESVAEDLSDRIQTVKINVDSCPNVSSKLGIRSLPQLVILEDTQEKGRKVGYMSHSQILDFISNHL